MKQYIHLVVCSDDGEISVPMAAFMNKKKAEKYLKNQKELDNMYNYYISSVEIKDREINDNMEVGYYYAYTINSDDSIDMADGYNEKEKESHANKGTSFVEVEENEWVKGKYYTIAGFDLRSYKRARELALEKYKELNKCT